MKLDQEVVRMSDDDIVVFHVDDVNEVIDILEDVVDEICENYENEELADRLRRIVKFYQNGGTTFDQMVDSYLESAKGNAVDAFENVGTRLRDI